MGIDGIMYTGLIADLLAAIVTIIMALLEFKDIRRLEKECKEGSDKQLA
jgi:hypothetical protein